MRILKWIPLFLSLGVSAQMTNAGAIVSLTENTQLIIDTDFINTGTLINRGTLLLRGDWQNLGVYNDTDGDLLFDGSTEQIINNNAQDINDIQILGGGRKVLIDDATINGRINFLAGKLVVQEGVSLTLGQGVQITGAGGGNFIEGRVFRAGTGDLFFPLGSGSTYLPVTLNDVSGNEPVVGLQVFEGQPEQPKGKGLTALSTSAYWVMSADASYSSGRITLPYSAAESFIQDTAQVVVAQATAENRAFHTLGRSSLSGNSSEGVVTSAGLAIGPYFSIGYVAEIPPLPPIRVINAITPYQDGKHDFLRIENIELYEGNIVEIFNRNGEKVFTMENYNNQDRVFTGMSNINGSRQLEGGTYFYTIRKGRKKVASGFIFLKY